MRQALAGFDWTEHTTSNIVIEFDGERARCRTYVHAYHRLEGGFCSMRGRWDQRFARVGNRWLIQSWTVGRIGPVEGDESLYSVAAARVAASG
jgi:SnoaL-like protein